MFGLHPAKRRIFFQFLKLPVRILSGIFRFPLSKNETKRVCFWSWFGGCVGTLLFLSIGAGDWKGSVLCALSILFSIYMMTEGHG